MFFQGSGELDMPTIVHFDIPADDMNRAKKFYKELFDWKIESVPGPMEYNNITTKDESGKDALVAVWVKDVNQEQELQIILV